MYTRCPACRAEISFEPPANMESLPDGYKHRIKCPSCGVTIGVKLNVIDTQESQFDNSFDQTNSFDPDVSGVTSDSAESAKTDSKADKKAVGRNVTMMIMSLIFIALSVIGYLVNNETITNDLWGIVIFDGISYWADVFQGADTLKLLFDGDALGGVLSILPMILFALAIINFITALISAFGKKYSKAHMAYNAVSSILIAAAAIGLVYHNVYQWLGLIDSTIPNYFLEIIEGKYYMTLISAGLGLLQLILGLCFIIPLDKDNKEKKSKKN